MLEINPSYKILKEQLINIIHNFNNSGKIFVKGKRNTIKIFELNEIELNVKSFKKPHFINQIIYRYFRKSKARRSFEFATKLLNFNIGTPKPIAYFENYNFIGLKESYYICEHISNVFEFRELVQNPELKNHELILRQFTKFCYQLHEKGVEFKDHSPGNTLIKDNLNGTYSFYLVDLNRMNFYSDLSFEKRMKNLSRLTPKKEMIAIMSNEYAKYSNENESQIFESLWKFTSDFQYRFFRKKRLKKKFLFWKK